MSGRRAGSAAPAALSRARRLTTRRAGRWLHNVEPMTVGAGGRPSDTQARGGERAASERKTRSIMSANLLALRERNSERRPANTLAWRRADNKLARLHGRAATHDARSMGLGNGRNHAGIM